MEGGKEKKKKRKRKKAVIALHTLDIRIHL